MLHKDYTSDEETDFEHTGERRLVIRRPESRASWVSTDG
jgi:hypothetical protein